MYILQNIHVKDGYPEIISTVGYATEKAAIAEMQKRFEDACVNHYSGQENLKVKESEDSCLVATNGITDFWKVTEITQDNEQAGDSSARCTVRWLGAEDADYLVDSGCYQGLLKLRKENQKKYEEFLANVDNHVDWEDVSSACCEAGNNMIVEAMYEVASKMGITI